VQGWSHMAVPAFGAEVTDGCTPATKVREDQERGAPAWNIASGASGGTGEMLGEVRRVQGRIATSTPKVRRSWTRGCHRRVKIAPHEAETRGAACKGVLAVRRHAGGLYDARTYCYTLVKCLKPFVRNGKGVIEANDYIQGVGDSPRGPLKQPGNPHLKLATSQSQTRLA
jgi:hypothetical protein